MLWLQAGIDGIDGDCARWRLSQYCSGGASVREQWLACCTAFSPGGVYVCACTYVRTSDYTAVSTRTLKPRRPGPTGLSKARAGASRRHNIAVPPHVPSPPKARVFHVLVLPVHSCAMGDPPVTAVAAEAATAQPPQTQPPPRQEPSQPCTHVLDSGRPCSQALGLSFLRRHTVICLQARTQHPPCSSCSRCLHAYHQLHVYVHCAMHVRLPISLKVHATATGELEIGSKRHE